jgi:hypothetical protein
MANYADSVLLAAVGVLDKKFNEKELRRPKYGAFEAFLTKRGMLIPDFKSIWQAEQRTLTAKYLLRTSGSVGTSRSCTINKAYGDSASFNISWKTYSRTVSTSTKIFDNNEYSTMQAFSNDIYNAFMDLYAAIETDAVAYLEANRTGVQGARTLNTWDGTNDVMQVAHSDRDNYLNYIKTEAYALNYRQNLMDIHSVNLMAMYAQQYAQGTSNDENLTFQFPGFSHYVSQSITNSSDAFGTSYIVEDGGIAVLDWIPPLNRKGNKSDSGAVWTTMPDPFGYPLTWSVYRVDGCVDTSGSTYNGATQDYVVNYEISVDLSFNHAPLSTTDEEVILKYELLST